MTAAGPDSCKRLCLHMCTIALSSHAMRVVYAALHLDPRCCPFMSGGRNADTPVGAVFHCHWWEQMCSRLVHRIPGSNRSTHTMEFASAHVASSVFSKLKGMDDEALQDMISACKAYPKAASLRGSMFELLAHSIISCRGKFSVRDASRRLPALL